MSALCQSVIILTQGKLNLIKWAFVPEKWQLKVNSYPYIIHYLWNYHRKHMAYHTIKSFTIPQDKPVPLWMVQGLCGQQTQFQWATHNHYSLKMWVVVGPVTAKCWVASHMRNTSVPDSLLLNAQSPLELDFLYIPASVAPGKDVSKNLHNHAHHSTGNKIQSETD